MKITISRMLKTQYRQRLGIFLLLIFSPLTFATDLMDVYYQALDNDPSFKMAYSTFLSQSENLPQAWSQLLPQLSITALAGRNSQYVDTGIFEFAQSYNGNQWSVQASQAIFNYQAWAQVQQAKSGVKAALATFNNAAQDLILRTAAAYLQILLAKDTLSYAEAKKRANKKQYDQAKAQFSVGVTAITSVYEAESAYDQSVAQVITAKNALANRIQDLSRLTNNFV